jgi:hypothetical protein
VSRDYAIGSMTGAPDEGHWHWIAEVIPIAHKAIAEARRERAGRLWAGGRTAEAVQLERFCSELAQDVYMGRL